jgi:N-acetylglucosamine-6-phosphate deacetylase
VIVKDGQCRTHEGSLAGSTLRMDQGVKNLVEQVGLSVEQALRIAAENPARSIGVYDRKGSLEAGKDADIVVLRDDLSVVMTIIRGQIAYDARN